MADIHSATAEIRRGKKEERRKKKERINDRMKIYMVCPITYGDHKLANIASLADILHCPVNS